MAKYIMGLDIGTSSIKGILMSADGKDRYTGREPFTYTCREDGSVEISAEDYLKACYACLKELASKVPADGELAAVSAASASGNLLLLDETGQPATPIYNWQDTRVTDEPAKVLGEDYDWDAFFRINGWGFTGNSFPLAQLCWQKVHAPERLDKASMVCMSTEYLYHSLTGKWGIGPSAGTPFYLLDQTRGTYNRPLLEKLGIPESKLPPIMKTGTVLGTVTKVASEACGLPEGTPVVIGTFDHPSAARGVGVRKEGQLLLSCGTSWVGFYPVEDREKAVKANMLIDPFLSEKGGPWGGMVSLASLSGQIEGFSRAYLEDSDKWFLTLVDLAAQSSWGAGGLTIDLLAEPDDAEICKYEKRHIARAIMECVVNMLAERTAQIEAAGIHCSEAVMVGGPSETPLWAKLIAEKTGMDVRVMHGSYAGAVGAATVAAAAVGVDFTNEV